MTRRELGKRLSVLRRARGWKIDQVVAVCKEAGLRVSNTTVWRIEAGYRELELRFLEVLASAWSWSVTALINRLYTMQLEHTDNERRGG